MKKMGMIEELLSRDLIGRLEAEYLRKAPARETTETYRDCIEADVWRRAKERRKQEGENGDGGRGRASASE